MEGREGGPGLPHAVDTPQEHPLVLPQLVQT